MDKRILAHQFVHFRPGQKMECGDFRIGSCPEVPGLSGLVDFTHAVCRRIARMENRKGFPAAHSGLNLGGTADELTGLPSQVHHSTKLLHQKPVNSRAKICIHLDLPLQGAGEELLRHSLVHERPAWANPASPTGKRSLQVGNNRSIRCGHEPQQRIG